MSTHENRNDDALRADGLLDDELRRRYRALADEQPSAETDAAILAAARREVGAGPQQRRRPGLWMGGLATAATFTLMVSTLLPSWRSGDLQEQVAARPAPAASAPLREATPDVHSSDVVWGDDPSALYRPDDAEADVREEASAVDAATGVAPGTASRALSEPKAGPSSGRPHALAQRPLQPPPPVASAPAAAAQMANESERQDAEKAVMAERHLTASARHDDQAEVADAKKGALAEASMASTGRVAARAPAVSAAAPVQAQTQAAPSSLTARAPVLPSAPADIAGARKTEVLQAGTRPAEAESVAVATTARKTAAPTAAAHERPPASRDALPAAARQDHETEVALGAAAAERGVEAPAVATARERAPASFYAKPAAARRDPAALPGSSSAFSYEAALVHGWYAPALAWLEQPPQANDAGREAERDLLRWLLAPASPPALRCQAAGSVSGQRLCLLLRRHAQGVAATDDELAALAAALRQERREPAHLLFALRQLPPPPAPVPERGISPAASSAPAP